MLNQIERASYCVAGSLYLVSMPLAAKQLEGVIQATLIISATGYNNRGGCEICQDPS